VAAALVRVKRLDEQAEESGQELAETARQLAAASAQVESEWARLAGDLRAFALRAREGKERLQGEDDQAGDGVQAVRAAMGEAQPRVLEELAGAQGGLSTIRSQSSAMRAPVAELIERLAEWTRDLAERAAGLREELQQAVSTAVGTVGHLVGGLEHAREALENRAHELRDHLAEELPLVLQSKFENWRDTLDEVEAIVAEAFQDAHEHVTDVVDFSLQECAARHGEAIDDLAGLVDNLDEAAVRLAQAIDDRRQEIEQAGRLHAQSAGETDGRLEAMTAALRGVRQLMARYGFTPA
jgi:hypothetical protein